MALSVFDLFKIGIGPSSSHTVGPMRAAGMFVTALRLERADITRVKAELFGSLGATGHGHGSRPAVLLGLMGERPESVDTATAPARVAEVETSGRLRLALDPVRTVHFDPDRDLVLHRNRSLPGHPNGMVFTAWSHHHEVLQRTYYSVGGGFVLADDGHGHPKQVPDQREVPYPFRTGADLLRHCTDNRMTIAEVALANELALGRSEDEVRAGLRDIWRVMRESIENGCHTTGVLPGGLRVRRRANRMFKDLTHRQVSGASPDPLAALDWLTLWAMAVNEENASGGRVVTAPTNGAAGIVPAVLMHAQHGVPETAVDGLVADFLLVAGAIGAVFQQTGSISGAAVGCQGEVGVACSMAAGGLCFVQGGSTQQVLNAGEIGLEHHLGLTCDPVGGLVQVPCIERNAVGAVQAVTAARLALSGDGMQLVTLDQCIKTMVETGADMKIKYKETARGGLAVNIVEC